MVDKTLNPTEKRQTCFTGDLTDTPTAEADAPVAEKARVLLITNLNSHELHAGALDYLRPRGAVLDDVSLRYPGHLPAPERISGILACSVTVPSYLEWVAAQDRPVVHLLRTVLSLPGWPRVVQDLEAVGRMGAEHLMALGDVNLAFYCYFYSPDFAGCHDGFVREVEAHGRTVHEIGPHRVYDPCGRELKVIGATRVEWLKSQLATMPLPLAVMTVDDIYATDLVRAARDLGLRIPDDLAILGVNNQPLVLDAVPEKLSSVDVDFREIARVGCELLYRMLDGGIPGTEDVPMLVKVPPKGVVVRDSTVTFRCDHPGVTAAALFIRRHFHETITVADVAAQAKMPVRTLQALYPQRLGCTLREDIQRQRLRRAQCLLQSTSLKLAAVAVESGFGTLENLCRVFQGQHRMTPHAWRMRG